jgi:hypothetical protein
MNFFSSAARAFDVRAAASLVLAQLMWAARAAASRFSDSVLGMLGRPLRGIGEKARAPKTSVTTWDFVLSQMAHARAVFLVCRRLGEQGR